jgi:hypothetical protein
MIHNIIAELDRSSLQWTLDYAADLTLSLPVPA